MTELHEQIKSALEYFFIKNKPTLKHTTPSNI